MKALIKNEIKMFFSKKNIILLIASCLLIFSIFHFKYEKEYNSYSEERLEDLYFSIDNAEVWSARYTMRLQRLKDEYPGHHTTPEAELMAKVWEDHYNGLAGLRFAWENPGQNPEQNEKNIINTEKRLDRDLIEVNENSIETGISLLYRDVERDWNKRMMLWDKHEELDLKTDINPLKPTSMYLFNDSINGKSYISLLFIILMIFLNFDIWSKEFDDETIRLIFTLPHSKTKIFNTRFITRFVLSIFSIIISILLISSLGFFKYGGGIDSFSVINQKGLTAFGNFDSSNEFLQGFDIITKASKIGLYSGLLFLLFLLLIYSIITFISYASRSQQLSILISIVGVVMLTVNLLGSQEIKESAFNLIQFIDIHALLTGSLGYSWIWAISILGLSNIAMYFINIFWVNYKE